MIHVVTSGMRVVLGCHCPYCEMQFAIGDVVVEDDHPLRHHGCGPEHGAPYDDEGQA